MTLIQQYIRENLPEGEVLQICKDYELFETQGNIGDCLLRSVSRKIRNDIFAGGSSIVMVMNMVAFECYRRRLGVF